MATVILDTGYWGEYRIPNTRYLPLLDLNLDLPQNDAFGAEIYRQAVEAGRIVDADLHEIDTRWCFYWQSQLVLITDNVSRLPTGGGRCAILGLGIFTGSNSVGRQHQVGEHDIISCGNV